MDRLHGVRRYLTFRIVVFFLFAPFVAAWLGFKFVGLPLLAANALAVWSDGYGIELTVEDWSADVLDLSATASGIVLVAPGPYAQRELLTADSLEVDLSLWSGLFRDQWIRDVRIVDPDLYLERLASGRWNWADLASLDPSAQLPPDLQRSLDAQAAGSESTFSLPRLTLDGMSLQWVESLPANSGGGLIQDLKASLYVDDIYLTASDLVGLVDARPEPSRLSLEARTGTGKISFDGRGNLFAWSSAAAPSEPSSSPRSSGELLASYPGVPAWTPRMSGKIYLENVEAGAFARLTPEAAIVPERGSFSGTMEFAVADHEVTCRANVHLRDVTFTLNSSSPLVNAHTRSVANELASYRANGQYQFSCGGPLAQAHFRPFQAFHTNVVQQGVREASPKVRAVAAIDHSRFSEDPIEPELEREVAAIARSLPPGTVEWLRLSPELLRILDVVQRSLQRIPQPSRRFRDRLPWSP